MFEEVFKQVFEGVFEEEFKQVFEKEFEEEDKVAIEAPCRSVTLDTYMVTRHQLNAVT